jgi:hypothetical protein
MNPRLRGLAALAPPILALALAACQTPVGPVEVTRFHDAAALAQAGRGTIAVMAAPGFSDTQSLEQASYQTAVTRELQRVGYSPGAAGTARQVAEVRVERYTLRPDRGRGPVSVGVGGSTGSYGSGVGLGIGLDLSGGPKEQVTTQLAVSIRDAASKAVVWEGRASFTVAASSPLAQTQLGAAKMAAALFKDFPGNNGETIEVE